jgi:hypothetical protein
MLLHQLLDPLVKLLYLLLLLPLLSFLLGPCFIFVISACFSLLNSRLLGSYELTTALYGALRAIFREVPFFIVGAFTSLTII